MKVAGECSTRLISGRGTSSSSKMGEMAAASGAELLKKKKILNGSTAVWIFINKAKGIHKGRQKRQINLWGRARKD